MFGSFLQAISGPVVFVVGIALVYVMFGILGIDVSRVLSILISLSPIWLPIGLFYLTYTRWMYFVTSKFVVENGRATLRIKLPQEVFKSPEAMESALNQIYTPNSVSNLMEAYLDGKHPLITSLELVSHGGEVRFYINTPKKKVKNVVEAQMYAHYPGIEIFEEPVDYAAEIKWEPETMNLMSFHIGKKEDDVMPIKTYIDMGLDKLPKEEEKLDPMAAIIEHLSNVKPHERLWIQFLLKPHTKQNFSSGSLTTSDTWEKAAKAKIDDIMGRGKGSDSEDEKEQVRLTSGERNTIEAIERNTSKWAFEVAIRAIYITTDKERFNGDMIGPLLRAWAQYDMIGRNKVGFQWRTDFDYNFLSDPTGGRRIAYKKMELEDYKNRYFYPRDVVTYKDKAKVFSVEEIATMYHIPGKVIVSPALTRVDSLKREAPSNLPTGSLPNFPS